MYATGFAMRHSMGKKKKMENKRSRPNEMVQKRKIQWKISLPEDIWNLIFLSYCDFDSIVTTRMLQSKYVKQCTESNDLTIALRASNLNNVKWIYQSGGVTLKDSHSFWAAELGTLSIMKWLLENGCQWHSNTFLAAAGNGDLNNMKWLLEKGCQWGYGTFTAAARHGDLNNFKWLVEKGCHNN